MDMDIDSKLDQHEVEDLCSLIKDAGYFLESGEVKRVRGTKKPYQLTVKRMESNHIMSYEDLMQPNCSLSMSDRMELAFRLSLAVLQLYDTPWIDESWTWADIWVSKDLEADRIKFSVLFIPREFYSVRHATDNETKNNAVDDTCWQLFTEDPVLTKLGFALIELALGRTMRDLLEDPDYLHVRTKFRDEDSINYLLAKSLLRSEKVCQVATRDYENVVKACILRQYRDQDGTVKALQLQDLFLPSVKEAIILPLFKIWGRYR
jgi:hypothetical protein